MDNKNLAAAKEPLAAENEKRIQKMKFCIISNFKSQLSKHNLMLFTLDNTIN